MSFGVLRGISLRIYRQALQTIYRRQHAPIIFARRASHNNLYQMVKKRTLEARTKLQANKYPNNQAGAVAAAAEIQTENTASSAKTKQPVPSLKTVFLKMSDTPKPPKDLHSATVSPTMQASSKANVSNNTNSKTPFNPPKQSPIQAQANHNYKSEQYKPKLSQNTEVLRARDCDITIKNTAAGIVGSNKNSFTTERSTLSSTLNSINSRSSYNAPCDPPVATHAGNICKETKEKAKGSSDKEPGDGAGGNDRALLYALLAALGVGGLLFWLWMKSQKKQDIKTPCEDKNTNVVGPCRIPASSKDLPKHVPYILIGGGTASFSAFRAIKSNIPLAKVLMITDEYEKPYMRPPLSKELWYSAKRNQITKDFRFKQWTGAERSLFFEPDEFFADPTRLMDLQNGGIAVAQGYRVKRVDPERRVVVLTDDYEIAYDECLIATGCLPRNLPVFHNAPPSVQDKVMIYRTPEDFQRLRRYADENKTITIIGNGFTGSELACSLANYAGPKTRIYQVFPEHGNMAKVLPKYLSQWTMKKVEETGVCVINNCAVKKAERDENLLKVTLNNGKTILSDVVVVCIGCDANTAIAGPSGLEVNEEYGGFVVNAELEARRNLYVAGDASCFYDPLLGRRRVEHHDHSVISGRLAGDNMTGKTKSYVYQSMFWSDLGQEIGYEGIGLVDSSLPTVGIFALPSSSDDKRTDNLGEVHAASPEVTIKSADTSKRACDENLEYGRGVIFYLKNDRIVGVLLWNLFNRIGLARTIINQNKKYDDLNEVAKLFEIHS